MIDCGEGTLLALRHTRVNFNKLIAVFITHLHGDHCLGLMGMLSSFGLLGRTVPLHIYAPKELRDILPQQMAFFTHNLGFEVVLHDVDTTCHNIVYEDESLIVEGLPLEHRMPCSGYLFREKEGKRSYAYCSDTRYMPTLCEMVRGVNLLYHEATYGNDNCARAAQYAHSTAEQAAQVAHDAGVGCLLLGHFSKRYEDESILLDEAQKVFANTILSNEGMVIEVK